MFHHHTFVQYYYIHIFLSCQLHADSSQTGYKMHTICFIIDIIILTTEKPFIFCLTLSLVSFCLYCFDIFSFLRSCKQYTKKLTTNTKTIKTMKNQLFLILFYFLLGSGLYASIQDANQKAMSHACQNGYKIEISCN